MKLKSLHKLRR